MRAVSAPLVSFAGLAITLLDWRADPKQAPLYRYVHHYSEEVLDEAGNKSGLSKSMQYFSDGKEGDLALYNVWNI